MYRPSQAFEVTEALAGLRELKGVKDPNSGDFRIDVLTKSEI